MYKKAMTKTKFKESMRLFWTKKWFYERSPQDWVDIINGEAPSRGSFVSTAFSAGYNKHVLIMAVDKLILEKKVTKDYGESLIKMIESPDRENLYTAVSIMAVLKPKKFKREK